ncbi:MAG: hypothetical protein CMI52_02260 [Parcubacteria group bacterium]|nr:hypothetical protein [Parcubacteria group bacterium]
MNPTLLQIIRGIGAIAVSNVVGRLSSFTTVVLLTTALSLYEYGLVMLALAITGPVLAIMSLGLDDMILADTSRYLADGKRSHAKRMLVGYLSVKAVLLVALIISGYFFRDFLATKYGTLITDASLILLLYVVLQYFRTSYNTILHIHKRFKTLAFWNSIEPIARLIFVAVAFAVGGINVMVALASYVASSAVTIVGATPQLLAIAKTYLKVPKLQQPLFRIAMKAHGKWQSALSMLGSFTGAAGVYIIKYLLSTEAVAIFSVAQSMFSAIASLTPIKTVMVPFISQWSTNKERLNQVLKKITKYSMLMYGVIMIAAITIGPELIHVFFPKYTASILVFQILSIRLLLNTFSITQSPTLTALRDQKFMSGLSIFKLIMLVLLAPPLIMKFGVIGAVLEIIITTAIIELIREWRLRTRYGIKTTTIQSFFTFDHIDRMILNRMKQFGHIIKQKLK